MVVFSIFLSFSDFFLVLTEFSLRNMMIFDVALNSQSRCLKLVSSDVVITQENKNSNTWF